MFKKLYLPLGMLVVLALGLLIPESGLWIKHWKLSNLFIILIFLVCGWQTDVNGLRFDRKFALAFVSGAVLSLICAPWIALGIAKIMRLPELPMIGLVVISAVPPTLSSGIVMTETAEGNVFLSMTLTIGYNLLGVLTLPVVLSWCLAGDSSINTNPGKMLLNLALLVVLPFFVGFYIKKLSRKKLPSWAGYIPSTCVIMLLFSFFSSSAEQLKIFPKDILLLAALAGLLMHILLLVIMWYGSKAMKIPAEDGKAMIFTGASKTLTIALTILTILGADGGAAVAPCLVFYFLQMLIDSALAGKMGIATKKQMEKSV